MLELQSDIVLYINGAHGVLKWIVTYDSRIIVHGLNKSIFFFYYIYVYIYLFYQIIDYNLTNNQNYTTIITITIMISGMIQ